MKPWSGKQKAVAALVAFVLGMVGLSGVRTYRAWKYQHSYVGYFAAPVSTGMGSISTPRINETFYVGEPAGRATYSTIQAAVSAACNGGSGLQKVVIPTGITTTDTPGAASGCAGVFIVDERTAIPVPWTWSGTAYTISSTDGKVNPTSPAFGAKEDNATDDAIPLAAATTLARSSNLPMYLPPGTFYETQTTDLRLLTVNGAGIYQTNFRMAPGVQKSVVYISLNTSISNFSVIGGWDGHTTNGKGYGVEATTSEPGSTNQLPYHMSLVNIGCQNTFNSSIFLVDAAYTWIQGADCHNSANHILEIQSHDNPNVDGFGPTTITVIGSTLSDTYNGAGAGIYDNDCVNCRFIADTMENTAGIVVIGPQNRSLEIEACYEENTSTGIFANFGGSAGLGLSMHGNRGGPVAGPVPAQLANWGDIDIKGNWFAGPSFGDSGFASTVRSVSSFFDPVATSPGEFTFNPGVQTGVSPAIYSPGAGWSAVLRGTFVDFTGGVTAIPPMSVVTSTAPTIGIGHTSVTFSMSSSGYLQGTVSANCCGATTVRFTGWIEVYSDRNHSGPPLAFQTGAGIYAGTYNGGTVAVTGAVSGASVAASGAVTGGSVSAGTVAATGSFTAPNGTAGFTGKCPTNQTPNYSGGIATGCS